MSLKDIILEVHSRMEELSNGVGNGILAMDNNNQIIIIFNSYERDDEGNETVKTWELTVKEY